MFAPHTVVEAKATFAEVMEQKHDAATATVAIRIIKLMLLFIVEILSRKPKVLASSIEANSGSTSKTRAPANCLISFDLTRPIRDIKAVNGCARRAASVVLRKARCPSALCQLLHRRRRNNLDPET